MGHPDDDTGSIHDLESRGSSAWLISRNPRNLMKPAIVCFGEVLLRLSSPGRELLLQSPRFDAHIGGAEANVAVSLHKFGHRTRVVSTLPDSTLGHVCADELRRQVLTTGTRC